MSDQVRFPADRPHRHVVFDGEEGDYCIQVVDLKGERHKLYFKQVELGPESQFKGNYRIKAVLSTPDFGVTESHWLTLEDVNSLSLDTVNQYRIKAVTDSNIKSDWVYSNVLTDQGEELIYNMLFDLFELISMLADDDVEALLDAIARDAFKFIAKDSQPIHSSSDEMQEQLSYIFSELSRLMSNRLKHEFRERITGSPKEFVDFAKVYRILDSMKLTGKGFVTLLIEKFLEETLEEIVQEISKEIVLENDEKISIYLEAFYPFDLKREIIRIASEIMLEDHFVLYADGAIKLWLDMAFSDTFSYKAIEETRQTLLTLKQQVHEILAYEPDETLELFYKLIIKDGYLPLILLDQCLTKIMVDLEDRANLEGAAEWKEIELYSDDHVHLYIRELVSELIGLDDHLKEDYDIHPADMLIAYFEDRRKSMIIDYYFNEIFDVLSHLLENVRARLSTLKLIHQERKSVQPDERWQKKNSKWASKWLEKIEAYFDEKWMVAHTVMSSSHQEEKGLVWNEKAYRHLTVLKILMEELLTLNEIQETVHLKKDLNFQIPEAKDVLLNDEVEHWYLLNPADKKRLRFYKHEHQVMLYPNLSDRFKIQGNETINYALGDMGEGWPIGQFVLGKHTLKGVNS